MTIDEAVFWSKVKKIPNGCWEWQACLNKGYGWVTIKNKQFKAHRVSYQLLNGPIKKGMHILHLCDNKKCVNPEHLYQGTHKQNMRDKANRGLSADTRGELNPNSKLTGEDVRKIRSFGKEVSNSYISKLFPVNTEMVRLIRHNKAWVNLGG